MSRSATPRAASSPRKSSGSRAGRRSSSSGGLLPILVAPLLIAFMPESRALRAAHAIDPAAREATPVDLFRHGLALRTSVLWMVNLFNLVGNYLILFWLPAILHAKGTVAVRGGDPRDDNVRAGHDPRRTRHPHPSSIVSASSA